MMALDRSALLPIASLAGVLFAAAPAFAAGAEKPSGPPPLPAQELTVIDEATGKAVPEAKPSSEVEAYCLSIADKAQDARHALQEKQLKEIEGEINKRIEELEARRADYQEWMAERKAFLDGASGVVVDIYSQMKADAAAPQLAKLEKEDAAMILVKLKSRQASAILSEMEPEVAAEVAKIIVEKTSTGGGTDAQETVAEMKS